MLTQLDGMATGLMIRNRYNDSVIIPWDELDEALTAIRNLREQHRHQKEFNRIKEELKTAYQHFFTNPSASNTRALYTAIEDYQDIVKGEQ